MIPFRVCCGKQHLGATCPDGTVMCCLCFGKFAYRDLSLDEKGHLTDVCKSCREWEQERMEAIMKRMDDDAERCRILAEQDDD